MTLLQKQTYKLWFDWVGNKFIEWSDAKPANTEIKNCVRGLGEIGQYVNQLNMENDVLTKRVSLLRSEKNQTIKALQVQIEELKNKLKKYEL